MTANDNPLQGFCTCRKVEFALVYCGDGSVREQWSCASCGAVFVRQAEADRAVQAERERIFREYYCVLRLPVDPEADAVVARAVQRSRRGGITDEQIEGALEQGRAEREGGGDE